MSLSQKIAHNTLIQIIGKILNTILGIIAIALMTRYLGREGFGAFTTVTAFVQFFGILIDMGLSLVAIQMISEVGEHHERNYKNIFTMRFFSALILYSLAPLAALFFPYPSIIKIGIAITALSFFLSSLLQILTVPFQVHLRMMPPMIADVFSRILLLGGIFAAITFHGGFYGILWAVVFNNAIQAILLYICVLPICAVSFAFDWDVWRRVFVRGWPIALSIIFNLVYLKADTIILSLYKSQSDVGIYGAAYRVFEVLMTLPIMFMGVTLGSFTHAWSSGDHASFKRYFQKSFDFMALLTLPIVVGTLFLAQPIMILIAGTAFSISGDILRILIIASGFVFFGTLFGTLINVIHEQKRMLIGYVSGALLGLLGYVVFIPTYSYWGAAWMTITAEALVAVVGFWIFYKKTQIIPSCSLLLRAILASMCMATVLFFTSSWNLLLTIFLATLSYGVTLYFFGGIPHDVLVSLIPQKKTHNKSKYGI